MVAVAVGPPGSSSARHLAEGLAPPEHPQGLPRDALDDGGRVTAAAYGGRLLRHVFQLLERQNLHVDLSIGSDTAPGGRRGPPAARPQLPFDGCGETQGQEEPLCDAS